MSKKIVLHNAALGRDSTVPNKPKLLRVLAESGWHPKEERPARRRSTRAESDTLEETRTQEGVSDGESSH
jgi:hypothetical protein